MIHADIKPTLGEMQQTVIGDRVVVRPDDPMEKTESGIYLPDETKDKERDETITGVIIGVGQGVAFAMAERGEPPEDFPRVGDRIAHSRYGVTEHKIGGETLRMMRSAEICIRLNRP